MSKMKVMIVSVPVFCFLFFNNVEAKTFKGCERNAADPFSSSCGTDCLRIVESDPSRCKSSDFPYAVYCECNRNTQLPPPPPHTTQQPPTTQPPPQPTQPVRIGGLILPPPDPNIKLSCVRQTYGSDFRAGNWDRDPFKDIPEGRNSGRGSDRKSGIDSRRKWSFENSCNVCIKVTFCEFWDQKTYCEKHFKETFKPKSSKDLLKYPAIGSAKEHLIKPMEVEACDTTEPVAPYVK